MFHGAPPFARTEMAENLRRTQIRTERLIMRALALQGAVGNDTLRWASVFASHQRRSSRETKTYHITMPHKHDHCRTEAPKWDVLAGFYDGRGVLLSSRPASSWRDAVPGSPRPRRRRWSWWSRRGWRWAGPSRPPSARRPDNWRLRLPLALNLPEGCASYRLHVSRPGHCRPAPQCFIR